jgi:hypothetical protein
MLGSEAIEGLVGEQAASLAEALGMDANALDATQSLNQFTDILMWPSCIRFFFSRDGVWAVWMRGNS